MPKITLTMSLITYEKLLERCAEGSAEYTCLRNSIVDSSEAGVNVVVICSEEQTEALLKIAASRAPILTDRISLSRDAASAG